MTDGEKQAKKDLGCAMMIVLFLFGILVGAWWSGRGVGERFESIERSQERIRARMYEIETKLEETVDE